jgi:hypothetical protein
MNQCICGIEALQFVLACMAVGLIIGALFGFFVFRRHLAQVHENYRAFIKELS